MRLPAIIVGAEARPGNYFPRESTAPYDCTRSARMAETVEKLTMGEPLTIDQLLEYLPALKEIPRAQLKFGRRAANC